MKCPESFSTSKRDSRSTSSYGHFLLWKLSLMAASSSPWFMHLIFCDLAIAMSHTHTNRPKALKSGFPETETKNMPRVLRSPGMYSFAKEAKKGRPNGPVSPISSLLVMGAPGEAPPAPDTSGFRVVTSIIHYSTKPFPTALSQKNDMVLHTWSPR